MSDARRAAVRIATVCALACASVAGHAQYASVNLESSIGVPAVKKMRSFKSMHYVNLVQQEYDFSCGSAALATLLRYGYGIDIPEAEMIQKMMVFSNPQTVIKNGFSMLDMKKFVETLGLEGRGFKRCLAFVEGSRDLAFEGVDRLAEGLALFRRERAELAHQLRDAAFFSKRRNADGIQSGEIFGAVDFGD